MALITTLEKKQNQTLSKSIEAQTTVEAALEALSNNKLNKTGKAASSSVADKLANTTAIGSTIKPVYFTDKGVPAACTYKLEKDVPSTAVFTDTHHKTYLYATGSTGTANAQTSNGATYLRLFDETTNRSSIKITGTGATKVSSDSHGVITINSTDNNTTYAAGTGLSLGGSNNAFSVKTGYTTDVNKRNYKVTTDTNGNLYVNVPWTEYGDDVSALTSRMEYLISMNPTIPPIIDTNLVLSNDLSITDTTLLGQIIGVLTYEDGTPRRTACMSFKDTGSGKITLNFTVSIYAESNAVLHYLLVSYFKDKNGIYKVYLGFRKTSGNFGHDAIKVEQYGTF